MASIVSVHEAQTQLARLVDEVVAGHEVIVSQSGNPLVRMVRVSALPKRLGLLQGKNEVPEDFNEPLAVEVLRWLEGG